MTSCSALRTACLVVAFVACALVSAVARAADSGPKLTFETLRVTADQLPADVKEVEGLHTVARQPRAFFETPRPLELAPTDLPEELKKLLRDFGEPSRKDSQSFQAEGGKPGSLLWFEYADGVPENFAAWFLSYLYGQSAKPSSRYPEWVYVTEKLVIVLSFPMGAPGGEWVKSHLRRFGIPASRWSEERARLGGALLAAQQAGKPDDGLAELDAHPDLEADSSFFCFMRGELGLMKSDYENSARGYRGALELHRSRVSPMEEQLRWACLDGLGVSLVNRRKLTEAVKVLEEAIALGRAHGFKGWSGGLYNLACAQALRRQYAKAQAALEEAISLDPKVKELARTDKDLEAARKRPEFRRLLE